MSEHAEDAKKDEKGTKSITDFQTWVVPYVNPLHTGEWRKDPLPQVREESIRFAEELSSSSPMTRRSPGPEDVILSAIPDVPPSPPAHLPNLVQENSTVSRTASPIYKSPAASPHPVYQSPSRSAHQSPSQPTYQSPSQPAHQSPSRPAYSPPHPVHHSPPHPGYLPKLPKAMLPTSMPAAGTTLSPKDDKPNILSFEHYETGIDVSPVSAEELQRMEEDRRQELIDIVWEYVEDGHGPTGLTCPEDLDNWPARRLERAIARAKDAKADADLMRIINLTVVGGARFLEMWRVHSKGKRTKLLGLGTAMQNTVDRSRNDIRRIARMMRGKFRTNPGISIALNLAICIGSVILSNGFAQTKFAQHPIASFMSNFAMENFGAGGGPAAAASENVSETPKKEPGFMDTLTQMFQGLGSATTAPAMEPEKQVIHVNKVVTSHSPQTQRFDAEGFNANTTQKQSKTTFQVRPSQSSSVDQMWKQMMNQT